MLTNLKQAILFFVILSIKTSYSQNKYESVLDKVEHYKNLFDLNCAKEKATDNRGNGNPDLYGTRNFRTILHGVAYRGGGNNYYHATNKRSNKNPLPDDGLKNLAKLSFDSAVYLYKVNFDSAPSKTKSTNGNVLDYYQIGGNNKKEVRTLLEMTYESIKKANKGPLYLHCWNGWHQSGYVSALLLRQFCGLSSNQGVDYWKKNTDTWNNGYDRIKTAIRDFVPYSDLIISDETKKAICPCVDGPTKEIKMELSEKEKLKSTLLTKVPFARNSTDISPGALTAIDEYILLLKSKSFLDVEIGGHTSSRGTDAYNQTISEKRAKIVYDYLLKEGVEAERLTFKGYGESKLLDLENNQNANDRNRRIEFKVTGINLEIQFRKNQYEVPKESMEQLLFIVELLNANSDHKIIVEGHTDSSGDLSFNQNLSNLRAKSVYEFITKRGVNKERVSYAGFGISQPRYSNETVEGRNKNRRIELKLSLDK